MKKPVLHLLAMLTASALTLISLTACSNGGSAQSFAEAHDAFTTKLAKTESDTDKVPAPPEGVFDLTKFPSKVGDLSAYVSSDPKDGQKHPLIIWIVGGWGNGIDEFPWSYASWDNDQTGSAFWEAGVLTMYPSFRGGNGNPGHYETLFGEVDDIASAYEYAATLPYVDPTRIYLGGHSTGGTRALLATEYTDKFRASFCFGAVDEIKYHNKTEFTFDTTDKQEFVMRSPIFWLDSIKTPTFIIEGIEGNSKNALAIKAKSKNENISCFVLEDADHFSTLAPVTELLAQKILKDTGEKTNITLTQAELETAMKQPKKEPTPVMVPYTNAELGVTFSYPFGWELEESSKNNQFMLYLGSTTNEENIWDMSSAYVNVFKPEQATYFADFTTYLRTEGYTVEETKVGEYTALKASGIQQNDDGSRYNNKLILVQRGDSFVQMDLYLHENFGDSADPMLNKIIDSVLVS